MKTKKKKSSGGGGGAQQFLVLHGEKIVVGIVIVVALWFAAQGLGYRTVDWQPSALEEDANAANAAIRDNIRTAEDEGVEFFDHAAFAEQIKAPIPTAPYRGRALWNANPVPMQAGSQSMSQGF